MTATRPFEGRWGRTAQAIRDGLADEREWNRALEQVVALLKNGMPGYDWVGIYLLEGDDLVLGPFRGAPSPHTRIPVGRGICGAAAAERSTIVVDDVSADHRYLACSAETRSEIVVPIIVGTRVVGEIDIDSHQPARFGPEDRALVEWTAEQLASWMADRS